MTDLEKYHDKLQIAEYEWLDYLEVQNEGLYNMLDPRARQLTDLDKSTYIKIIKNYDELYKFFGS